MSVSQTVTDEFNRCRGRLAGLFESFGLPEQQTRGCVSTMKSLSYDAQAAIIKAVEGDELAVALAEARVARKELLRQRAILAKRQSIGTELPTSAQFVEQRLVAIQSQVQELETLQQARKRLSNGLE